jgi:hypothetical protein
MKRSTFSPTQIAGILKEFDNGKAKAIPTLQKKHSFLLNQFSQSP